jgi:hypothetical protein
MNIYDLPIPNFGELEDEAALKLILAVRSRRRILAKKQETKTKVPAAPRAKKKTGTFNTPLGTLSREQLIELMAKLKS